MAETGMIRLYAAMKKMSENKRSDNMVIGTVKSVNPLEVDIGNNVVLGQEFLHLGQMCRPQRVTIPHRHTIDTILSERSPSIGSHVAGNVSDPGGAQEKALDKEAESSKRTYTTLNEEDGSEESHEISEKDLGRGELDESIAVVGDATVSADLVKIKDNGHVHLIGRHETEDVHLPKSDYEDSVTIEIHPKLAVGDRVLMFAFNDFQMYYVAERIENG